MNATDEQTFHAIIEEIFAALGQKYDDAKRGAFWNPKAGIRNLSLVDVSRVRDAFLESLQHGKAPRWFTIPDFWEIKRNLRAKAPAPVMKVEEYKGDYWDGKGNEYLYEFLCKRVRGNQTIWGRGPSFNGLRKSGGVNADASPEFVSAVMILVAYKRAWAQDMRECTPRPSDTLQASAFKDCMDRAEADIAAKQNAN